MPLKCLNNVIVYLAFNFTPCSGASLATDGANTSSSSLSVGALGSSGEAASMPSGSVYETHSSARNRKKCHKCFENATKIKSLQKKNTRLRKRVGRLKEKYNELLSQ